MQEHKALFSGDHVMGWSTSIVSPPDGDMSDYMDSLELLLDRDDVVYWPTHGPGIEEPKPHVRAFIQHRKEREQQIIDCLEQGISNIREMVPAMYHDTPEFMYPAAARSVLAAMDNLVKKQRIVLASGVGLEGEYRLV